jgi:hypothetical protein
MAARHLDELVAQVLALSEEDRAQLAARVAEARARALGASARPAAAPRLVDLAGTGKGLWGDDSAEYLRALRAEWP